MSPSLEVTFDPANIGAAESYLNQQVEMPVWDELAAFHNSEPLPRKNAARLAGILALTSQCLDFRGLFFAGGERQTLDYTDGEWEKRLGLPGIDDPGSKVATEATALQRKLGLVEPMGLPDGVQPKSIGALGCFGPSILHRIEVSLGFAPTCANKDGKFIINPGRYEQAAPLDSFPHFTLSSSRELMPGEHEQVRTFAPVATSEFDITVAASKHVVGGRRAVEVDREELHDVGYEIADGEKGLVIFHQTNNRTIANIRIPKPAHAPRSGRAQTSHSYLTLIHALEEKLTQNDAIAFATNAEYGPFQLAAAVNALQLRQGWQPHMLTFTGEQTGNPSSLRQVHLRRMPEIHSFARHLSTLHENIVLARLDV